MKFIRFIFRFLFSLLIAAFLVVIGLYISGNSHLIKAVRNTYLVGKTGPTIDDYTKFENRIVLTNKPLAWKNSKLYNTVKPNPKQQAEIYSWETSAFLVVKDRELFYENYAEGYSEKSLTNTFSVAKSFVGLAIGAAIKEGKIKSVQQKVGDFLPEFKVGEKNKITIEDLLTMSSGIDFGESYGDPFGFMAKAYYGNKIYDITLNKEVKFEPKQVWKYQGGNTLLLSFILKKATGENLSNYFSKHFWQELGASENALWTISESDSLERSYCCFYSNARDFARVGQLILDSGAWNGKQLISQEFFIKSFSPVNIEDENGKIIDYYGYHWWFGEYEGNPFYYARGILGQYIVAIPAWNTVFVRLGNKRDPTKDVEVPSDLYTYIAIVKDMVN